MTKVILPVLVNLHIIPFELISPAASRGMVHLDDDKSDRGGGGDEEDSGVPGGRRLREVGSGGQMQPLYGLGRGRRRYSSTGSVK